MNEIRELGEFGLQRRHVSICNSRMKTVSDYAADNCTENYCDHSRRYSLNKRSASNFGSFPISRKYSIARWTWHISVCFNVPRQILHSHTARCNTWRARSVRGTNWTSIGTSNFLSAAGFILGMAVMISLDMVLDWVWSLLAEYILS